MYFGIGKLSASIALNDSSDSSPQVNPPHSDFSQQIPKATKTPATRFCPEKVGVLRTSESNDQLIRKKAGFHGQSEKNDDLKEHVLQIIIGNKQNQNASTLD